jgi:hypothetical protein
MASKPGVSSSNINGSSNGILVSKSGHVGPFQKLTILVSKMDHRGFKNGPKINHPGFKNGPPWFQK